MANLEAALEQTLLHPTFVVQSKSDSAAELLYRYYISTKVGDKWLCIVVKYSADDAFVVTAYLTNQLKKGIPLWPNP